MSLKTGLLIGTNHMSIRNLYKLVFQSDHLGTLYVKLLTNSMLEQLLSNPNSSIRFSKDAIRKKVVSLYQEVQNMNIDVRILLSNFRNPSSLEVMTSNPIEIVYFDSSYSSSSVNTFVKNFISNKSVDCRTVSFSSDIDNNELQCIVSDEKTDDFPMFDNVVLGGTFDKLHIGHKLLLSEAVMKCRKRIVVGVSAESMLHSKILPELIDDYATRSRIVNLFLNDVEPSLEYEIVTLRDIYGPTKTDPSFEVLVISPDTIRGAEKINEYRQNVGLRKLHIHIIDLIATSKSSNYEEDKVSSSNLRMRMLGQLLRPPNPRPNLPIKPYIIGLTGGIASGKSSISSYLQKLGCGYVNCDQLAHQMYDLGSPAYNLIRETFGLGVLNEDGTVNRKQLGSVVFSDQEQLKKLNNILWPFTLQAVKEKISTIQNSVVVVEAALLIQANWGEECHEIWSCIIPPKEAITRLQNRNNLSAEEAQLRIDSQPRNQDYVAHSNVIFSTLWDPSYTETQVEKAWNLLKQRLPVT